MQSRTVLLDVFPTRPHCRSDSRLCYRKVSLPTTQWFAIYKNPYMKNDATHNAIYTRHNPICVQANHENCPEDCVVENGTPGTTAHSQEHLLSHRRFEILPTLSPCAAQGAWLTRPPPRVSHSSLEGGPNRVRSLPKMRHLSQSIESMKRFRMESCRNQ